MKFEILLLKKKLLDLSFNFLVSISLQTLNYFSGQCQLLKEPRGIELYEWKEANVFHQFGDATSLVPSESQKHWSPGQNIAKYSLENVGMALVKNVIETTDSRQNCRQDHPKVLETDFYSFQSIF